MSKEKKLICFEDGLKTEKQATNVFAIIAFFELLVNIYIDATTRILL
jgi:hypothetical protein